MLVAEDLVKCYPGPQGPLRALDGFGLAVAPGEVVGLIGHNGAGKSTFVEVVTGLTRPDSGSVRVAGVDALRRPRRARALLGVAPQELALYPTLTVRDNLMLHAAFAGGAGREARGWVTALAEELMLGQVLDQRVGLLSGGQKRRTQAATAMVGRPRLLLLDEPTAGADPETREALLAAVRARAEQGCAVLYTTHYLPELDSLEATLAVARAGRVLARGSRAELTRDLPGELRVTLAPDSPPLPDALRARLLPSPEPSADDLRISGTAPADDLAALLAAGCVPTAVDIRRPDLDDLYRALALTATAATRPDAVTEARHDAA